MTGGQEKIREEGGSEELQPCHPDLSAREGQGRDQLEGK